MVRLALVLAAGVALGVACFPPPLDETGLLCDDTRPCDMGYLCFDGVCGRIGEIDAGPDNWLGNPSFEDPVDGGPLAGWSRAGTGNLFRSRLQAHTGIYSALLLSTDGGNPTVRTRSPPVLDTLPKQTWCARAWAKSNTDDGGVGAQIIIREADDAGATIHDYAGQRVRTGAESWVQVSSSANTVGAAMLDVRVGFAPKPADGTQQLWVDDVQLERSIDGTCPW